MRGCTLSRRQKRKGLRPGSPNKRQLHAKQRNQERFGSDSATRSNVADGGVTVSWDTGGIRHLQQICH